MMTWFLSLADRERLLIGFCTALGLVALGYVIVVEPLQSRLAAARVSWANVRAEAAWLEGKAEEVARLTAERSRQAVGSGRAPQDVAEIEAAIKDSALADRLTRIAPQSGGRVEVVFGDVSYLKIMAWMIQNGIAGQVETLALKAKDDPDQVDASFVIALDLDGSSR